MTFTEVFGGQRTPILLIGIRTWFTLHFGNNFLNGLHGFIAPSRQQGRIGPNLRKEMGLSRSETITAER
jgi:hypothetical protein